MLDNENEKQRIPGDSD